MALTLKIEQSQVDTGHVPPLKGGRPSLYRPHFADIAKGARLFGATQQQLAEVFNVSEPCFIEWIKANPDLAEAIAEAESADYKVMGAFYKRAVGYNITTTRSTITRKKSGERTIERQEVVETVTHVPADIAAAKQWLRLRRAWGDNEDGTLEGLLRFAAAARAEAARRGLDLAAPGPPTIEASASGPGADDDSAVAVA